MDWNIFPPTLPDFCYWLKVPTAEHHQTKPSNSVCSSFYITFVSFLFFAKSIASSYSLLPSGKYRTVTHRMYVFFDSVQLFAEGRCFFSISFSSFFCYYSMQRQAAAALGAAASATLHKLRAPWGVWCAELNLRARLLSFRIFVLQMEVDGGRSG